MRSTCKRKPRQGGFFLLPNEIFTLGLSAGEIAVYAYLLFAGLPPRKAGKKAVKPNSPLCGDLWPARGWGRENNATAAPDRPCWARVSQL